MVCAAFRAASPGSGPDGGVLGVDPALVLPVGGLASSDGGGLVPGADLAAKKYLLERQLWYSVLIWRYVHTFKIEVPIKKKNVKNERLKLIKNRKKIKIKNKIEVKKN